MTLSIVNRKCSLFSVVFQLIIVHFSQRDSTLKCFWTCWFISYSYVIDNTLLPPGMRWPHQCQRQWHMLRQQVRRHRLPWRSGQSHMWRRGMQWDSECRHDSTESRQQCHRQPESGQRGSEECGKKGLETQRGVLSEWRRVVLSDVSPDMLVFCVQLQDIASLTQDVKNQAMTTLEKAQKKKDNFEKNNKKLKDFIKEIKDFLTGILPF